MPLRWAHDARFRGLILRRDTSQLDDLLDKAFALYPKAFPGAKFHGTDLTWTFPSGARIWFTHCQHEKDIGRFDGHEYHFIGFDELTHFSRDMFVRICARLRGPAELPKIARATTNPGGEGHEWVFKCWAPWLDPKCSVRAEPGERLWYLPPADGETDETWCEQGATRIEPDGSVTRARSRVFIPAKASDNPAVGEEYLAQLRMMDPVRRAQLKDGNWLIKPAPGLYFKRVWFEIIDSVPAQIDARIRYWDRAASVDGDYTAGARYSRLPNRTFCVEDMVHMRGRPGEVKATILSTAESDPHGTIIGIEEDPGQAGVADAEDYVKSLDGYNVRRFKPTGDKITRAQPVSAQCEGHGGNKGNVLVVRGAWNDAFFNELESFPGGKHDDQVDALSGAHNALSKVSSYSSFKGRGSSRA